MLTKLCSISVLLVLISCSKSKEEIFKLEQEFNQATDSSLSILSGADIVLGKALVTRCTSCHDTKASSSKDYIGPTLFGIVDRQIGSVPRFNYSQAMKAHSDKKWTLERLSLFVKAPSHYVPGTTMRYRGISNQQKRIDLIAYLNSLK